MKFKGLALDLDGTFLSAGDKVSAANLAAVRDAQAAGMTVMLATARWHVMAERIAAELPTTAPLIACSGAQVRSSEGVDLVDIRLPRAFAAALYDVRASEVFVTARHPQQTEAARSLGATVVGGGKALALAHGEGSFDCVIETVGGEAETLGEAINLARPGGTISMLGVFSRPASIPALAFSNKELTLVGSNCYARSGVTSDFAIAVQLLERHKDAVSALVMHRFPLSGVNDAFAAAADKKAGSIKVQIEP